MSRFIIAITLLMPVISMATNSDFSYDKEALSVEFNRLDKVADFVEETKFSYTELSGSHVFDGELNLTNSISVKPELKLDDMDWKSFAWGFCCWPVGIFTVLINDKKDKNSKESFWAGVGSAAIATTTGYIIGYALLLGFYGGVY